MTKRILSGVLTIYLVNFYKMMLLIFERNLVFRTTISSCRRFSNLILLEITTQTTKVKKKYLFSAHKQYTLRLGAQSSYVVKYFEGSNAVKTTSMRN